MTDKEALEHMGYVKEIIQSEVPWTKATEAIEVTEEALKKQIPKKPRNLVFVGSKELYAYCCPKCEKEFLDIVPKYCYNCGQAIEWEEVSK